MFDNKSVFCLVLVDFSSLETCYLHKNNRIYNQLGCKTLMLLDLNYFIEIKMCDSKGVRRMMSVMISNNSICFFNLASIFKEENTYYKCMYSKYQIFIICRISR